jgi:hypothetical protein
MKNMNILTSRCPRIEKPKKNKRENNEEEYVTDTKYGKKN